MANSFKHYFWPGVSLLWAIIIFILCALPQQDIPDPGLNIPHLDKVVHFGMFFIMSVSLCWWSEYWKRRTLKKVFILAVAISFLYGGIIEVMQYQFFNRGGDWWDLTADVFGGVAGCWAYPIFRKLKDRLFCKKRSSH